MIDIREISPDAVSVEVVSGYRLRVGFENGEVREFDAKAQLMGRKCYSALANYALFSTAHIENGAVTWNDELDIDPEWLYRESVQVK